MMTGGAAPTVSQLPESLGGKPVSLFFSSELDCPRGLRVPEPLLFELPCAPTDSWTGIVLARLVELVDASFCQLWKELRFGAANEDRLISV